MLSPDEWRLYRTVRLAALREAPYAFGARYEDEVKAPDERWRQVVRDRARFVAEVGGKVAGTVSGGDSSGGGAAAITAMWVDPRHRRKGVGDRLVSEVLDWARESGYRRIVLCVRDGNIHAERLYERHGFIRTGLLCSEAPAVEYEMGRTL